MPRNNEFDQQHKTAGKTAISRGGLSAPTRYLLDKGLIKGKVFQQGRGKAEHDAEAMAAIASKYSEYDPNYAPNRKSLRGKYDTVVSNFVLNTLPPTVRDSAWKDIQKTVGRGGTAYISVRSTGDKGIRGEQSEDGVITSKGTFQKPYSIQDIMDEAGRYFGDVEVIKRTAHSITVAARDPINPGKIAAQEALELQNLGMNDLAEEMSEEDQLAEIRKRAGIK
jgi:hypothetical protein